MIFFRGADDLGEAFLSYFRPSQGKVVGQNTIRCPIKIARASRRPYIKLDEKVVRKIDPDLRNKRWTERLDMLGAPRDKLNILEQTTEYTYQNLPVKNVLSRNDLMDKERQGLTDGFDEADSLISVPMVLSSYWDKEDMVGAAPKVMGGVWTHSSPYQLTVVPTYVCKSSCIYGRKSGGDVESQETERKDYQEIVEHARGLLDCGMSREETFQTLSLTEVQKKAVLEILNDIEEPLTKRSKIE